MAKQSSLSRETGGWLRVFAPAIVVVLIGFAIAFQFVAPPPPRDVILATGSAGGAYTSYGKRYAEILARDGINVKLRNTSGSVENLNLLNDDSSHVDLAFVQGGLASAVNTESLVTLGSLFLEPLWIFHSDRISPQRLGDLKGLKISVGAEGSGTRKLVQDLLQINGVTPRNSTQLFLNSQDAATKLLSGEIDVVCIVANSSSKTVLDLLSTPEVELLGLERAAAYAMRFKYLHVLTLPEGVIDLTKNIPSSDRTLVAPTAQLVARSDLHPALVDLLLQAAEEIHAHGGPFEHEGEFPSPQYLDFQLSDEAKRFYKNGPPFFQRYLPFWIANFLSRMKVMLVPLIALLFPFFKIMPAIYRWRMRSRIYRWYTELEAIDEAIHGGEGMPDMTHYYDRLDVLEQKVLAISVPHSFSEEQYQLRLHIDLLRKKLQEQ
jgi:TRAP transporter TAXI family solute receptor